MIRAATLLWAVLAVIAGTGLFMLKYEVQGREHQLTKLRKEIVNTQESIHVLKAEWSYLNDPQRLREQAERHLGMHPLKPTQIGSIDALPMAQPAPAPDIPVANSGTDPLGASSELSTSASAAPAPAPAPVVPAPVAPVMMTPVQPSQTHSPASPPQNLQRTPEHAPSLRTPPGHPPSKPGKVMTAQATAKHPVKLAAKAAVHKGKTTAIASAKTLTKPLGKSPYPVYAPSPGTVATATPTPKPASPVGNVLVITSPSLADPEMASTRTRR